MAPNSQIDSSVTERIESLVGKDKETVKEEMRKILDDCVTYSLCSDFSVAVMDGLLNDEY